MPVERYRRVEDMPPVWRAADDPGNLAAVAAMIALYWSLRGDDSRPVGVRRYRSFDEMSADGDDPYRR